MSTLTDSSKAMPAFPQAGKTPRESYSEFFDSLCDIAGQYRKSHATLGLLGLVLTEEQYAEISDDPFVLREDPGPPNPRSGPNRRAAHAAVTQRFRDQQEDIMNLKSKLLSPISPDIITRMSQPILKMTGRDIPWICTFLFDNFGLLTPREMEELTKSLDEFFFPDSMTLSAHCARHISAHNLALRNNEPFREHQKVTLLKRSLLSCNIYTTALEAWARDFPTIAQQTFENLHNAV